jgi:TolA-binding protein
VNAIPAILKFGLPGLAAIVVFLAYKLLLDQSKKERPNRSIIETIKAFMALGIVLAIISAISSATELITSLKQEESLSQLRSKLSAADGEIRQLRETTGSQQTTAQLEQKLLAAEAEIDHLKQTSVGQREVARLESELDEARKGQQEAAQRGATQRDALDRIVADAFEQVFAESAGKMGSVPPSEQAKVRGSLLRRAVFINILTFQADGDILRSALQHLVSRGFPDLKAAAEEVVRDLPNLKVLKLRWLQDVAIPELNKAIDKASRSPMQAAVQAKIPLPREFVVLDVAEFGQPSITLTDMVKLQQELDLLKKSV